MNEGALHEGLSNSVPSEIYCLNGRESAESSSDGGRLELTLALHLWRNSSKVKSHICDVC